MSDDTVFEEEAPVTDENFDREQDFASHTTELETREIVTGRFGYGRIIDIEDREAFVVRLPGGDDMRLQLDSLNPDQLESFLAHIDAKDNDPAKSIGNELLCIYDRDDSQWYPVFPRRPRLFDHLKFKPVPALVKSGLYDVQISDEYESRYSPPFFRPKIRFYLISMLLFLPLMYHGGGFPGLVASSIVALLLFNLVEGMLKPLFHVPVMHVPEYEITTPAERQVDTS